MFTSSPASGTPANWTYTPLNGYTNGHQYQLTATAKDNAQNTNSTSVTFVYDVQVPTSSITNPAPGYITSWTTISGKANDQIGAPPHLSGISTNGVSVAVQQVGGNWWDGSGFNGSNPLYATTTFVGASSGTWSYTLPAPLQGSAHFREAPTSLFHSRRITPPIRNSEPWQPIFQPARELPWSMTPRRRPRSSHCRYWLRHRALNRSPPFQERLRRTWRFPMFRSPFKI